jgi:hypothetical protein
VRPELPTPGAASSTPDDPAAVAARGQRAGARAVMGVLVGALVLILGWELYKLWVVRTAEAARDVAFRAAMVAALSTGFWADGAPRGSPRYRAARAAGVTAVAVMLGILAWRLRY